LIKMPSKSKRKNKPIDSISKVEIESNYLKYGVFCIASIVLVSCAIT